MYNLVILTGNYQPHTLTWGKKKEVVLSDRFKDINTEIEIEIICEYIHEGRIIEISLTDFDYVVNAIDTHTPKIHLILNSLERGLKIVSSMGAGGKRNPGMIKSADISKSHNCKLARMLRKRLGKRGIKKGVKVVFSPKDVPESAVRIEEGKNKKSTVGTISYMPPLFDCHILQL